MVAGLEASPWSEVNVVAKLHRDLMSGSGLAARHVCSTFTHNTISIAVPGSGDHFLREPPPSAHARTGVGAVGVWGVGAVSSL